MKSTSELEMPTVPSMVCPPCSSAANSNAAGTAASALLRASSATAMPVKP